MAISTFSNQASFHRGLSFKTRFDPMRDSYYASGHKDLMGRRFSAIVRGDALQSEWHVLREMIGRIDDDARRFYDDTRPVSNGPDEMVWASECLTNAVLAEDLEEAQKWLARFRRCDTSLREIPFIARQERW